MPMLYEMALLTTVGLVAWIALDVALDPTRRRRLVCVITLAVAALAWTCGELLLDLADTPAEVILSRRVLFAGICLLPAAWVWCASVAARPDSPVGARRLFLGLLAPSALVYTSLYLLPSGVFIDWYAVPVHRGPLFYANAGYSWALICLGSVLVLGAMLRNPGASPARIGLVLAAAFVPVIANAAYLILHVTAWDPTPVAIGFSALAFRFVIVDLTWGAYHSPVARAEVVAQMHAGVLVADLAGRVVDWNDAAAGILRTSELEGRRLRRLLATANAVRAREIEVFEFPLVRRGQIFGTGAVVTDRTEMRRAELRLEMTTRIEALGYMAAGVAHEINNPLSYVSVNLTLLDRLVAALRAEGVDQALPGPLGALIAEGEELISDAREGTERIQRIVERMVQSAPGESTDQPTQLDVRYAVEKAVALASLGKRTREMQIAPASPLPRVAAPEMDVIQIVLHLLHNAVQMGGDDVPISIDFRAVHGGVEVRVADGGPGIAERDLPHVFEPFFTTRRPGSALGLGLSMCWELARRSGGRLEVENGQEHGAVFTLFLPSASEAHSDAEASAVAQTREEPAAAAPGVAPVVAD